MNTAVPEYVNVRASEPLARRTWFRFLKFRFPDVTKPVGRTMVEGTECVEVRVRSDSPEFEEIRRFIDRKRKRGQRGFSDFTIFVMTRSLGGRHFARAARKAYSQTPLRHYRSTRPLVSRQCRRQARGKNALGNRRRKPHGNKESEHERKHTA